MTSSRLYSFEGRSGRLSFALTQIAVFIFSYVAAFVLIVLSGAGDEHQAGMTPLGSAIVASLAAMAVINAVWVSLAAAVRRCHDRGLSGWMLLFVMPPLLGQLWLVLSLITGAGDAGANRHGERTRLAWRDGPEADSPVHGPVHA